MALLERERTSAEVVIYALYLYFLGLSFRNTSKALEPFDEKRSYVAMWLTVHNKTGWLDSIDTIFFVRSANNGTAFDNVVNLGKVCMVVV